MIGNYSGNQQGLAAPAPKCPDQAPSRLLK